MITSEFSALMAEYNCWMNDRLYALCATLDDGERRKDRGAFFGSIHRTLEHILYGDLAFMSRFTGDPAIVPELGGELCREFVELRARRLALDARIAGWARGLTADWLALPLTYVSKVDGRARTVPRWALVGHMFNHQTHHRGQAHGLLSQTAVAPPPLDLLVWARETAASG